MTAAADGSPARREVTLERHPATLADTPPAGGGARRQAGNGLRPPGADGCGQGADRGAFLRAMRRAATGVTLVATDGAAGRLGLTVSAVSSVSADPPMVLACIHRRSPVCAAVRANGAFSVNLLATRHRHLAESFAGHPRRGRPYDFSLAAWEAGGTGAPLLRDALATFDCVLETVLDAGSHTVFIGRVAAAREGYGSPLLYTDRAYGRAAALGCRAAGDPLQYKRCT